MDPDLYPRMAQVEDRHWWFAARRAICERLLDRLDLAPDSMILEAGCGTGGNFAMLARRGVLFAMDSEPAAIRFAQSRGLARIEGGSLPEHIPFAPTAFDLVVMTDVLEHLDDDRAALEAVRARIKPGGHLLATVPAMPSLWSEHDGAHHHLRRYRLKELRLLFASAGFEVTYLSYYNIALFPAIAAIRTLQRMRAPRSNGASPRHDLAMPREAINSLLFRIFSSERHLIGAIRFPFGVSLIALAQVPAHR